NVACQFLVSASNSVDQFGPVLHSLGGDPYISEPLAATEPSTRRPEAWHAADEPDPFRAAFRGYRHGNSRAVFELRTHGPRDAAEVVHRVARWLAHRRPGHDAVVV